jgi:hypothetical protein
MQTEHIEATVWPTGTAAERARRGFGPAEGSYDEVTGWPAGDWPLGLDEVPAAIRAGSVLVLAILCLGIAFQYAFNRGLKRIGASTKDGLAVISDVDSIIDGLNRLSLSQRSFLRTGDLHFSLDESESVIAINLRTASLRAIAAKQGSLRDAVIKLSGAIDGALRSLGTSNDVEKSAGTAAALKFLDNDVSIEEARTQAEQVRRLATEDVFHRVRAEHRIWLSDLLF